MMCFPMRSSEFARLIRPSVFISLFLLCSAAIAGTAGVSALAVLEEPRIVAVNGEGEIHISFSQEIRYLRHFPESQGDTLRVFLEVADPCAAEQIVTQESRWLPAADWYVPFTVSFPEIIKRSGSGTAVCSTTQSRVDVAQTLLVKFRKMTKFQVRRGNNNHSIIVVVPLLKQPKADKVQAEAKVPVPAQTQKVSELPAVAEPSPKAVTPESGTVPATPVVLQPDVQARAQEPEVSATPKLPVPQMAPAELMAAGRAAISAGDYIKATQIFNQLLDLPPNDFSQEGQELVGLAREMSGEADKAKAEYQLYLKLYPEGEGAAKVRQRLAALEAIPKQEKVVERSKRPKKEIHQNTFTGSLSQYYYSGSSQNRVRSATGADSTLRSHDQAALITNVDGTGRFRHNELETKIVFRNTETHNFLSEIADKNTLSAAYVEHSNKDVDYMFRIGRQSGTSQGVMGRFDGVFGRYGLNPQWRIAAVVGQPDDGSRNTVRTDRHFYGAALEFGPLAEKWSGSVYGIQQIADGLVERRALGTEVRYFNGNTSWFGTIDYDTIYEMVNVAMLQANWVAFDGYNFNLLLDHRKSPMLYAETAIQGKTGADAVGDLRATLSNGDIYDYVRGLVPDSDLAMLGITKQVTDRWQLGGDVRYNRTYNTDGAGDMTGQPGSGHIYAYTAQAIGTNTLFKDDSSVIMLSYMNAPKYNAQNLSFSNSVTLRDKWRVDSSLRYYHEKQSTDISTWKVTPTVRINYHWRDNMSFEAEASIDRTHTDDPVTNQKIDNWRETIFAGYRWDFR